jgi:hypothetical protein
MAIVICVCPLHRKHFWCILSCIIHCVDFLGPTKCSVMHIDTHIEQGKVPICLHSLSKLIYYWTHSTSFGILQQRPITHHVLLARTARVEKDWTRTRRHYARRPISAHFTSMTACTALLELITMKPVIRSGHFFLIHDQGHIFSNSF